MEDLGLNPGVSVQMPSRPATKDSFEIKALRGVRDRFLSKEATKDPWNLLDLQNPFPPTLPIFVRGDDCQLLLRIRDSVLMDHMKGGRKK